MVELARGFLGRGMRVDIVVAQREGPNLGHLPPQAGVVDLKAKRVSLALPALTRYLRKTAPDGLISALPHANVIAVAARCLAGSRTRLVLTEHTTASLSAAHSENRRGRVLPMFMRFAYPSADAVVAVSNGVADDLARLLKLDRSRITTIYNPIAAPRLIELSEQPVEHEWFADRRIPVILSAGRLTPAKDFLTLIRAFGLVRKRMEARLVILGEGNERARLEDLIRQSGVDEYVALPGFVQNPYKYMRSANLFVMSSRWEGFGNVLVEAMACGCPVASTDCPSGPREILDNGRYGRLAPVGDEAALAQAIVEQLEHPIFEFSKARALEFSLDSALNGYQKALMI